jgi:unsaturated chondroitin disaccharide hydrolase
MTQWQTAIEAMTARVDDTAQRVDEGFPHYADVDTGEWITSPEGDWTGAFWNGMLWLALHRTGDERYRTLAERWTDALRPRASSETVFRGFLFYYGAVLGDVLASNELAREVGLDGAKGLASLYDPVARAIPLGNAAEESSDVGRTEANIDGVPGGSLLVWASEHTGDQELRRIAVDNALRHIDFCLRGDGSVVQSASFDPDTGEPLRRYTHKGYSDDSTWTRAQAWGMLGFAMIGQRAPEHPQLIDAAERTADWWISHVPQDLVAYWDFDAPQQPGTKRDTSGTAIAAAALLKLSALTKDRQRSSRYRAHAEATVAALVDTYLTPVDGNDGRQPGMLTHACYNHRIGLATENELIWGDYYLYEALHVLADHIRPTDV